MVKEDVNLLSYFLVSVKPSRKSVNEILFLLIMSTYRTDSGKKVIGGRQSTWASRTLFILKSGIHSNTSQRSSHHHRTRHFPWRFCLDWWMFKVKSQQWKWNTLKAVKESWAKSPQICDQSLQREEVWAWSYCTCSAPKGGLFTRVRGWWICIDFRRTWIWFSNYSL